MCLIALAWQRSTRLPLLVAANRDEAHARPTLAAHEWPERAGVFGGKDLQEGGSWMALSADGRLAAVTNVRERPVRRGARSRGHLVRDFMLDGRTAADAAVDIVARAGEFGPFNLLLTDGVELVLVTNRPVPGWQRLPPGVYAVSNGVYGSAWPKIRRLYGVMSEIAAQLHATQGESHVDALLRALGSTDAAPDHELPDTGVGLDAERQLSPIFVTGDEYGTRASSVALLTDTGAGSFVERSYGPGGVCTGEQRLVLQRPA